MTVDACDKQKMMEDSDDDDMPLVFKRSSSSAKQNQSNSETKPPSQKHDPQLGRSSPDVRPQNGIITNVQKGKLASSSKKPPVRSPLASPKSSNSSAKALPVKTSDMNAKPSTSVAGESKYVKPKEEKTSTEATGELHENTEDSEDDKPLSARLSTGLSKVNPNHANKPNASNLEKKPNIPKREDSDDDIPLSTKFQSKPNAAASTSRSSHSEAKNSSLVKKSDPNGSASTERKPSPVLQKRPAEGVASAAQSSMKKPKLSDASISNKNKQASVKAEVKAEDDEDHIPISQRMKKSTSSDKKSSSATKMTKPTAPSWKKTNNNSKKVVKNTNKYSKSSKLPPSSGEGQKWTTLVHNGVIFPPPYKPHGVKMIYKGKPVDLTPEQEEVHLLP